MESALRILHLEDETVFFRLVQNVLVTEGVGPEIKVVSDPGAQRTASEADLIDMIVSDYCLPTYTQSAGGPGEDARFTLELPARLAPVPVTAPAGRANNKS